MGGAAAGRKRRLDPAVRDYIHGVSGERRALFLELQRIILEMAPEAPIAIAYGVPTYGSKPARVGLGYWTGGVSFYPYSGSALDEFRLAHPTIRTTKSAVNLKTGERIPRASLKKVIRAAMARPAR